MFTQKISSKFLLITIAHPTKERGICGGMKATINFKLESKII